MIVIGARPAVGKSAFVSQIALAMAKAGLRIGFYNLEMSDKQVYERLLSSESGIGLTRIRRAKGFLGGEERRFQTANKELASIELYIRSGAVSVSEIRNECRHLGLDCLIIDYIQLLRTDIRYQSRASEGRENKEPIMGELREDGDRTKKGLKVDKNRQGESGTVVYRLNGNEM